MILEKVDTNISDTIDIVIAKIYLVFGNTRVAKKKLIQILDRNAENYTAHKLLAGIYVKEGGQRKAVDEYLQVIDINPKDFESYYNVSELLIDLDKKDEAIKSGAECMFIEKYPDIVTVYSIGDVSKELCGGPHVKNTKELGKFKIKKEEASSAGVRRIKAVLE